MKGCYTQILLNCLRDRRPSRRRSQKGSEEEPRWLLARFAIVYQPTALYIHQEAALRRLIAPADVSPHTVVASGTGSGKTECFLLPALDWILGHPTRGATGGKGIRVLMVYPLNALVNDQIRRLRPSLVAMRWTQTCRKSHSPDIRVKPKRRNTRGARPIRVRQRTNFSAAIRFSIIRPTYLSPTSLCLSRRCFGHKKHPFLIAWTNSLGE